MTSLPKSLACAMLLCSMLLAFSGAAQAQQGMGEININGQLVMAARAGVVPRVQALLAQGAKPDSRDRNGDSPLNMAAARGRVELADVLLRNGADVNLANIAGVTPLMAASFSGSVDIVRKLLAAGARIAPEDRVRKNAAVYAAANGCTLCLAELIKAGTDVNARLANDLTLLMWAAGYGHEGTVRLLLEKGADRTLKDARGKTAAEIALEGNYASIRRVLEP